MSNKGKLNFDFGPSMHDFANVTLKEILLSAAETNEYRGIGGHDLQFHGPHGWHEQFSLGINDYTLNIRKIFDDNK